MSWNPCKVIELSSPERGKLEIMGVRREVNFSSVEDVKVGDRVILHVGSPYQNLMKRKIEKTKYPLKIMEVWGKSLRIYPSI